MDDKRIVDDFRRHFVIVPARSDALRQQAYRIRYRVYADELGWEDRARFPDGQETDDFDANAESCLLKHHATGQFVGCVRLVLHGTAAAARFPFEHALEHAGQDPVDSALPPGWRAAAGEISRVAVVPQFRRRANERGRPDPAPDDTHHGTDDRRVFPHIAMGLYLGAAALGMNRGLAEVYAIMEPKLARRLRLYGIEFEAVGAPLEHHGTRVPYRLRRDDFESRLTPPIRLLLEAIQEHLRA